MPTLIVTEEDLTSYSIEELGTLYTELDAIKDFDCNADGWLGVLFRAGCYRIGAEEFMPLLVALRNR